MKILLVCFALLSSLLMGCASSRPLLEYDAVPNEKVNTFFLDGVSIASHTSDSCFFSLAIDERAIVGGYGQLRVWCLYQNLGEAPYLLRPWAILRLDIVDSATGEKFPLAAASPNSLLSRIDEQQASQNLLTFLGGALQAIQVSSSNLPANQKVRAQAGIVRATTAEIAETQQWFSIVQSSVASGLLQKNTVFPGESVNGYVYFPLKSGKRTFTNALFSSKRWRCTITVSTPTGDQEVNFIPVEIE